MEGHAYLTTDNHEHGTDEFGCCAPQACVGPSHTHTCMHARTHTHTHTHTLTHTHAHTNTHSNTHTHTKASCHTNEVALSSQQDIKLQELTNHVLQLFSQLLDLPGLLSKDLLITLQVRAALGQRKQRV